MSSRMYLSEMNGEAIRAADKSRLPQTVAYHKDIGWHHGEATAMRAKLPMARRNKLELIVTWLPERFFA